MNDEDTIEPDDEAQVEVSEPEATEVVEDQGLVEAIPSDDLVDETAEEIDSEPDDEPDDKPAPGAVSDPSGRFGPVPRA